MLQILPEMKIVPLLNRLNMWIGNNFVYTLNFFFGLCSHYEEIVITSFGHNDCKDVNNSFICEIEQKSFHKLRNSMFYSLYNQAGEKLR